MNIRQWKNLSIKGRLKSSKIKKILLLSGILSCIITGTFFVLASGSEVYSLTIAGKNAGYITDTALVDEAVQEIKSDYANEKDPINVTIDKDKITYQGTDFDKDEITPLTVDELKDKITVSNICTIQGWVINADGKNIVSTVSKKEAEQILDGVKNHYLSNGGKLISASFKENVTVTQAAVSIPKIMKPADAVTFILVGEKGSKIYTVKDGDTIWDIADENGISADELQKANPGFDPNQIKIGQQLNLYAVKPFITIETKELVSSIEEIPFNTIYEETSSLNKGVIKVKTPGVSGAKEISVEVTKENGIITATKVIQSVVTSEPKDQIALKGTKSAVRYIASRGGSSGRAASVSASGSDIVAYAEKYIGV
ncbi:MAG: G5 domain-containing protein, partial [Bacillota bacterium]